MRIFFFFLQTILITCIPVPNGQLGNVEVECGEDTIEAVFLTEAPFLGRIFVIGHALDPNCVSRETGRRTTSITINKTECGVVTTRSSDPNGLFSTVKIMISFHTDFVTKVDRGYEISCFYMVADKTVTYPLSVAPEEVAAINEFAEMPRCRYEVIDIKTSKQASVVTVGTPLLHKWVCDSGSPDHWCMTVHTCEVQDGSGTHFKVLDDAGCSVDKFLLRNLEYPGNLEAQVEAHAFKFADKVVTNFQCSIRLDIKNGECPIPSCRDTAGFSNSAPTSKPKSSAPRRGRSVSSVKEIHSDSPGVVEIDVRAPQVDVIDAQADFGFISNDDVVLTLREINSEFCVPRHFYFIGTTLVTGIVVMLSSALALLLRNRRNN